MAVDWSKTPFGGTYIPDSQKITSGGLMSAPQTQGSATTPPNSQAGGLMSKMSGVSSPAYKVIDFDKLPKFKSSGVDWGKYGANLAVSGANDINSSFDKADNTNRDILGGGGLYGSSIFADTTTQSANQRGSALASNFATAQNTATQGMLNELEAENNYNVQMQKLIMDAINGENSFNLDSWKNTSQLQQERDITSQNQIWQSGENTLSRDQDKWKTQGAYEHTAGEALKERLWKSGLQDSQNQFDLNRLGVQNTYDLGKLERQNTYDLEKLDKTFTHDDTTLDKTQTYNKQIQEYLTGKITQNWVEAQEPTAFDEKWYLQNNPDVAAAVAKGEFKTGLEHYKKYGADEQRAIGPTVAAHYENVYAPGVTSMAASDQAVLNFLINSILQGQQISGNKEIANISADAQDSAGMWSAGGSIAGAVLPGMMKKLGLTT